MTARVMVFAKVATEVAEDFEQAFLQVTERMRGTPGLLADELLRDTGGDGQYVLLSEWESLELFQEWFDGETHRATTAPMRPYWASTSQVRMYDLAARQNGPGGEDERGPAAVPPSAVGSG